MLGKLSVLGRPTILITVGQGPTALAVGAGGGCLDIFTLIYPWTFLLSSILSSLSPSLCEAARYRLKYCLKGPLNPKQPTNQPIQSLKEKSLTFAFLLLSKKRPRSAKKVETLSVDYIHSLICQSRFDIAVSDCLETLLGLKLRMLVGWLFLV